MRLLYAFQSQRDYTCGMKMNGNTILITGGGSGIGLGLAEAFHKRGNQVIVAGRREQALKEVCAANTGMSWLRMDVTDLASIHHAAAEAGSRFPRLNCVINNAGIQRVHDFTRSQAIDDGVVKEEIDTNLLGLIRVTSAFLTHLEGKENATLINVSSGLGFVPLSLFPVYCATKAAVHSFCLSLRRQLRESGIKVIEIVPPLVASDLKRTQGPPSGAPTPMAMPLEEFITATMVELESGVDEAAVGHAKRLVAASEPVKAAFAGMNA
jgi:uncharacterized oxidoreductase